MEYIIIPIIDKNGQVVYFELIGRDITECRKTEKVLQQKNEERYRTLVSNIPGAVYRSNTSRTLEFISDGIQNITGYFPSDIINDNVRSYASIMHPDDI